MTSEDKHIGASLPPGGVSFARLVADETAYVLELDRLARVARGRRVETLVHDGVRVSQMLDDADRLARLLARAVGDASYRPGPATLGHARIGSKVRAIGRVSGLDLVVHGVVARAIAACIEPTLSSRLYSYRARRSPWQAIRWLARLPTAQRATDVRKRGLFVLRADVSSYTDSIPTADDALLFRELFEALGLRHSSPHARLVERLLRPEVDGAPRERGLLFGLPTTNVIGNFYLAPLDRLLETKGGYARYGDDIVFVHADAAVVREATSIVRDTVTGRGLRLNEKKLRVFCWNGAPRASDAWPEAEPTRDVTFLGASIRWNGVVGLPTEKWRVLLRDVRARIRRSVRLAAAPDEARDGWPKRRARTAIAVAEAAFDAKSPLSLAHAPLLIDLVDDRAQLAELDYLVAKWIAEASAETSGPRAFREVPWKWMRQAGLGSRVATRNRG